MIYIVKGGKKSVEERTITVDTDRIRQDLIDWFGASDLSFRMVMLGIIESSAPEHIVEMALNEGWDLTKYQVT